MKQTLQLIIDDDLDFDKNYKKIYIHRFFKKIDLSDKDNVVDYHWNNYEKLKKDYEYLDNFGKRLLSDLAVFLNKLHKVNHSSIFWEILLGEWLHSFCFQIFDRYEMLNNLDYKNFNYLLKIKKFSDKDMIFQTIDEHNNIFFIKDYNSYLFYKIIDKIPSLKSNFLITKENIVTDKFYFIREKFSKKKRSLKKILYIFYKIIFAKILRSQKYPILRSYLGLKSEILINLKLQQLPSFIPNNYFNCKADYDLRKKLSLENKSNNSFEKFIYKNIFLLIPVSYIEGFFIEEKKVTKLNLPTKPKKIFSANINGKSLLKRYCALQKDKGCKLILATHGGSYGHYDMHSDERFEKSISDLYLTWGWKDIKNPKVKPFGIIRPLFNFKRKIKPDFLTMVVPAVSYFEKNFESHISLIHKNDLHFNPYFKIINNIKNDIKLNNLLIRFYPRNFGLNEFEVFNEKYPKIRKDRHQIDYKDLISNTRIFLSPYLGTGYLETLALNIPTIVFNSKRNSYLIRDDVKNYYQNLKKVKIFFDDEHELSSHINNVWKEPKTWWNSKEVQDEIKNFTNEFAYIDKNKLTNLKNILIN